MPEGPGAVQTLPIGCISLATRYIHFGRQGKAFKLTFTDLV